MAQERQSPDALLDSTSLAGTVTDIQDDPNSPDSNWLTSTGSNGVCRVSFPTPSNPPATGADLQQFKYWVRKDASGGGDPTATIELYENGALVTTLVTDVLITSATGQLLSYTWDASNLSSSDGSGVETRLVLSKGGGGPNERNVEVGAIEWNVETSDAGTNYTQTLSGNLPSASSTLNQQFSVSQLVTGNCPSPVGVLSRLISKGLSGLIGAITGQVTKKTTTVLTGVMPAPAGIVDTLIILLVSVTGVMGTITGAVYKSMWVAVNGSLPPPSGETRKSILKGLTSVFGSMGGQTRKQTRTKLQGNYPNPSGHVSVALVIKQTISGIAGLISGVVNGVKVVTVETTKVIKIIGSSFRKFIQ